MFSKQINNLLDQGRGKDYQEFKGCLPCGRG